MNGKRGLYLGVATAALLAVLAGVPTQVRAQQTAAVSIGDTDLGGVVRGPNGPEAGVWVIAETNDLPDPDGQDRGHRRSRALRDARPAEGQLHGVGARLWLGRFAEDHDDTRQDRRT